MTQFKDTDNSYSAPAGMFLIAVALGVHGPEVLQAAAAAAAIDASPMVDLAIKRPAPGPIKLLAASGPVALAPHDAVRVGGPSQNTLAHVHTSVR